VLERVSAPPPGELSESVSRLRTYLLKKRRRALFLLTFSLGEINSKDSEKALARG